MPKRGYSNPSSMKIAIIIARVLLGIVFAVFGMNAFLHFIPHSDQLPPGQAGAFVGALFVSKYFYAIAPLQVLGGLIVLLGRYVAVGLVLLGPIIVNILLFHICLAPVGAQPAIIVALLELFLIWAYRDRFAPIFKP